MATITALPDQRLQRTGAAGEGAVALSRLAGTVEGAGAWSARAKDAR